MSAYRDVIKMLENLEKENRVTGIIDYITGIEHDAQAALQASERSGNAIQTLELRADLRAMRRIKDYILNG